MWLAQGPPAVTDAVFLLHQSACCFWPLTYSLNVDALTSRCFPSDAPFSPTWCAQKELSNYLCKPEGIICPLLPEFRLSPNLIYSSSEIPVSLFPFYNHHHSPKYFWKAELLNYKSDFSCGYMKSKWLGGNIYRVIFGHHVNYFLRVEFLLLSSL